MGVKGQLKYSGRLVRVSARGVAGCPSFWRKSQEDICQLIFAFTVKLAAFYLALLNLKGLVKG
jgi:hypothetical protein